MDNFESQFVEKITTCPVDDLIAQLAIASRVDQRVYLLSESFYSIELLFCGNDGSCCIIHMIYGSPTETISESMVVYAIDRLSSIRKNLQNQTFKPNEQFSKIYTLLLLQPIHTPSPRLQRWIGEKIDGFRCGIPIELPTERGSEGSYLKEVLHINIEENFSLDMDC